MNILVEDRRIQPVAKAAGYAWTFAGGLKRRALSTGRSTRHGMNTGGLWAGG